MKGSLRENYLEKIYNKIKHLIIITENNNNIEIKCIKNDLIYTIIEKIQTYKKDYFYQDPFQEIFSEFQNNKIKIESNSSDELKMIFNHIKYIKNIISDNKPGENEKVIKKKDLEFHISKKNENDKNNKNNKININVIKDKKSYTFNIDENDNYDDFCDLIENVNIKCYEKKEEDKEVCYLEIDYDFTQVLKFDKNITNTENLNIFTLNLFMNIINDEPKNQTENIYLSKYIKDLNTNKEKALKRMENSKKEIDLKKDQIEKDNQAMLKNIKVMKDNAELMIFPKNNIPTNEVDNGVNLDSYIIRKINDFNLINDKLKQIYEGEVDYILVYRASRDRDLAKIFKEKCKYIRGTLIVVKTDEKKIFGGFTKQVWDDSDRNYDDERAFCFSLNLKKIYGLKEYCSAIGCDKGSGPRFNYMFMINNKCFLKGGQVFKEELSHYDGQKKDFELTGGEEFFNIVELEAFKISPKD